MSDRGTRMGFESKKQENTNVIESKILIKFADF